MPDKLVRAHIEATFLIPEDRDSLTEVERWLRDLFCETYQVVEIIEENLGENVDI